MAGRFEKLLDRRVSVREGEAALSEEARQRLYDEAQGPVAVPSGTVESLDIGIYSVSPPGEPAISTIINEDAIGADFQVVDTRFLGERGKKYDRAFDELRGPGVETRQKRIKKMAGRFRFAGSLAVVAVAGGIWGASNLPFPEVTLTRGSSCEFVVGSDQYVKPAVSVPPTVVERADTCTIADNVYVIYPKH
ncbi:MAG TPA: hypothetical protein VFH99_04425 [Candidatus Saccharimonadales bacterium]|nr:hypothetical protein [Candidatus Saccharimonadales bacterium]